ncbi:hypothetical protein DSM106972_096380 [Dulcicalothrix desertica PCC 7102]|uniref:Uncharacterized protein n=1 Tax=Dulcicalothrix desertica PCC 7102 TaxID=232991 RepID=A0A433UHX4_9CYAN|nr:hypothetical protein [Dulcicalothrix desertica]RUS93442.1 hypothetical protein DSM106972_096380 [Dulcicalothrix desertica PCC 7102]TWH61330.1 hypothetical protein CAL7102_00870 [Dulcicalothrix desertica PCC 7102]
MDIEQPNLTEYIALNATTLAQKLLYQNEGNKFLRFTYNVIKVIQSDASAKEYWAILNNAQEANLHLALVSLPLSEYLCFSGASEEVFEIAVPGLGFKYESICRFDNDFVEVVYYHNGKYTQVFGTPSMVNEFKAQNFPTATNVAITTLKGFFTIALVVPKIQDDVQDTAIRRSTLRFAVTGLNKFADYYRKYVGIPWASVPHYSFYSFPYGYIREFDLNGNLLQSDKYMMNPAMGVLPKRPYCIDPDGSLLQHFSESLKQYLDSDIELSNFRKGEAYAGHGHDLAAMRFCVSGVDGILRKWAEQKGIQIKNTTPNKAPISKLLGKFEEILKQEKLVNDPDAFMKQVRDAVSFRHSIEHESLHAVDSTLVFPAIDILKQFFDLVRKQLATVEQSST